MKLRQGEKGEDIFKKPKESKKSKEENPLPEFTETEVKEVCASLLDDITKYLAS